MKTTHINRLHASVAATNKANAMTMKLAEMLKPVITSFMGKKVYLTSKAKFTDDFKNALSEVYTAFRAFLPDDVKQPEAGKLPCDGKCHIWFSPEPFLNGDGYTIKLTVDISEWFEDPTIRPPYNTGHDSGKNIIWFAKMSAAGKLTEFDPHLEGSLQLRTDYDAAVIESVRNELKAAYAKVSEIKGRLCGFGE